MSKRACPCCGYLTLEGETGHFDICPVCFWADDGVQREDPLYEGGANEMSLKEAQDNFRKMGAVSEEFVDQVRRPKTEEVPCGDNKPSEPPCH